MIEDFKDYAMVALALLGWVLAAALALCAFVFVIWVAGHFGDLLGMWEV